MFKNFTLALRRDPLLGLIVTLITGMFLIAIISPAIGQTYSPTPRAKVNVIGVAFQSNNLKRIQFNRCSGEGNLQTACKENTAENAVILNKPSGAYDDGSIMGKGVVSGYRSDDEPFTWVNDETVLTLSFPDRNECYFIVDGKYLVGTVNEKNPADWMIMMNKK